MSYIWFKIKFILVYLYNLIYGVEIVHRKMLREITVDQPDDSSPYMTWRRWGNINQKVYYPLPMRKSKLGYKDMEKIVDHIRGTVNFPNLDKCNRYFRLYVEFKGCDYWCVVSKEGIIRFSGLSREFSL